MASGVKLSGTYGRLFYGTSEVCAAAAKPKVGKQHLPGGRQAQVADRVVVVRKLL
jgi:hypothetical protein